MTGGYFFLAPFSLSVLFSFFSYELKLKKQLNLDMNLQLLYFLTMRVKSEELNVEYEIWEM